MTSSGPGSQRREPFVWLVFLLDSRLSYESLEGSGSKIMAKRPENN